MNTGPVRSTVYLAITLAVVTLLLSARWVVVRQSAAVYRKFPSTGGRYEVVVYRRPSFLPTMAMPGQGSDGPGFVELHDKEGHVLDRADVDAMISNVDTVYWSPQSVDVKLVAEWRLPTLDIQGTR